MHPNNRTTVGHYIKERTRDAQFVIISLRNNMFELADRLVGIYKTDNATKTVAINPGEMGGTLRACGAMCGGGGGGAFACLFALIALIVEGKGAAHWEKGWVGLGAWWRAACFALTLPRAAPPVAAEPNRSLPARRPFIFFSSPQASLSSASATPTRSSGPTRRAAAAGRAARAPSRWRRRRRESGRRRRRRRLLWRRRCTLRPLCAALRCPPPSASTDLTPQHLAKQKRVSCSALCSSSSSSSSLCYLLSLYGTSLFYKPSPTTTIYIYTHNNTRALLNGRRDGACLSPLFHHP